MERKLLKLMLMFPSPGRAALRPFFTDVIPRMFVGNLRMRQEKIDDMPNLHPKSKSHDVANLRQKRKRISVFVGMPKP